MSKLKTIQQLTMHSDEVLSEEMQLAEKINEELFSNLGFKDTKTLISQPSKSQPWLLEGILPLAGTSLWAGREKVGKTTLIRQLCLSVAKGVPFLGKPTRKGLVMYYALEENEDFLKEDLKKLNTDGVENLLWRFGLLKEQDGLGHQQLDRVCDLAKPSLIILDTMIKFLTVNDLNSYGEVVKTMSYVTDIARKHKCHILYVHHMNKSNSFNDRDRILGSVGTQAEVDTIVTITKDNEDTRYLQTTQRYGKPLPKTRLGYDEETKESSLFEPFKLIDDEEDELL